MKEKKKAEQLRVLNNALAISPIDSTDYFNQLKGNSMVVDFIDGKIPGIMQAEVGLINRKEAESAKGKRI